MITFVIYKYKYSGKYFLIKGTILGRACRVRYFLCEHQNGKRARPILVLPILKPNPWKGVITSSLKLHLFLANFSIKFSFIGLGPGENFD